MAASGSAVPSSRGLHLADAASAVLLVNVSDVLVL